MHNYKEVAYYYRSKELSIFLKRVISRNILLQSNFKKGIDHDLLLIQQKRNLKFKLNSIQNETKNYELKFKTKYDQRKNYLNNLRLKYLQNKFKEHYKRKFDFLFNKQKDKINALNAKRNQKTKKKSYQRYKNGKKLKKRVLENNILEQPSDCS